MGKFVIDIENVDKQYRIVDRASDIPFWEKAKRFVNPKYLYPYGVKGLSLKVERGEFIGLIGANGAGKTTTIKLLTGILTPTSGNIQVLDFNPSKQRKKYTSRIGVVMGAKIASLV